MSKTMRDEIINRIDFHIEMIQEDMQSTIDSPNSTDSDYEGVAYDLKRIRNMRELQNLLKEGKMPTSSLLRTTFMGVMEEMMDLDI